MEKLISISNPFNELLFDLEIIFLQLSSELWAIKFKIPYTLNEDKPPEHFTSHDSLMLALFTFIIILWVELLTEQISKMKMFHN